MMDTINRYAMTLRQTCLAARQARYLLILIVATSLNLLSSCDTENGNDCFQTDGDPITRTIELPTFNRVRIDNDVNIVITQGDTQEIIVETRQNLLSDLAFFIEDDTFIARNNNGCNLFRDTKLTTVRLTTPNLVFIKNNSFGEVRSEGVLAFPTLRLESITTPGLEDVNKSGDFFLEIDAEDFRIVANGNSDFFILSLIHI